MLSSGTSFYLRFAYFKMRRLHFPEAHDVSKATSHSRSHIWESIWKGIGSEKLNWGWLLRSKRWLSYRRRKLIVSLRLVQSICVIEIRILLLEAASHTSILMLVISSIRISLNEYKLTEIADYYNLDHSHCLRYSFNWDCSKLLPTTAATRIISFSYILDCKPEEVVAVKQLGLLRIHRRFHFWTVQLNLLK